MSPITPNIKARLIFGASKWKIEYRLLSNTFVCLFRMLNGEMDFT